MTTYGVTATGFVIKPIETILSEIQAAQQDPAVFGPAWDVSAQSPQGQINGIMAAKVEELWQVLEAIYSSIDPDNAEGVILAALSSLTGTVVKSATFSQLTAAEGNQATVNLNAGFTLPAGSIASVAGNPNAQFKTLAPATNSGGAPANIAVDMQAVTAGPVTAPAGTLTTIVTALPGWNSVTNAKDAVIGSAAETDPALRVRRETELRGDGLGTIAAIRVAVRNVTGVTACTVLENIGDVVDSNGLTPHSIMVLVQGGAANAIAQAIWDTIGDGIATNGSSSGTAVDDQGNNQTVHYQIPTGVTVYLQINITKNHSTTGAQYPADGDTEIKNAIVAWAQANLAAIVGAPLILSQVVGVLDPGAKSTVPGVLDVQVLAALTPSPVGTANITPGALQFIDIESANIGVTAT